MIYLQLFVAFLIVGLVSFGGGYAMVPLLHEFIVDRYGWMNAAEFTDMVAIAGMSPGPIAANSAAIVGYHQAGLLGGVIASAGIVFPSFVIVLAAAGLMKRMRGKGELLQSAFYGLRPAITGLIVYAAIAMAWNNGLIAPWSWHTISQLLFFAGCLIALLFFRVHPVIVILVSGVVGAVLYS